MATLRALYRYWSAVVFLAVLAQVGAAGYGAFYVAGRLDDPGEGPLSHKQFENGWDFHSGFGYAVIIGTIVLLAFALLARVGRPRIWWPLALVVAGILQVLFAWMGSDHAGLGFLHPLDALVIFTVSGLIVHRAWRARPVTAS